MSVPIYNNLSTEGIKNAQKKVDAIQDLAREAIKKQLNNIQNLEGLKFKSNNLKDMSKEFFINTEDVLSENCFYFLFCFFLFVMIILGFFFLFIIFYQNSVQSFEVDSSIIQPIM